MLVLGLPDPPPMEERPGCTKCPAPSIEHLPECPQHPNNRSKVVVGDCVPPKRPKKP